MTSDPAPSRPRPAPVLTAQRRPADPAPAPLHGQHPQYVLLRRQLDALEAWTSGRRREEAALRGQRSREQRLDLSRRTDVLREQHRAIVARTQEQLRRTAQVLGRPRSRVVVVHRNAWFADRVAAGFTRGGLEVVARLSNGAEAVGVVVAEQPDLVLVEDALPMLTGDAVVREVRRFAPATLVGAQVASDRGVAAMLDAGAAVAYPRQVPPAEVAEALVGLLQRTAS